MTSRGIDKTFDATWLAIIAAVVVMIASVGGWVANIVKIIGADFDPLTGMLVARIVGIFLAPLGAVLGYF